MLGHTWKAPLKPPLLTLALQPRPSQRLNRKAWASRLGDARIVQQSLFRAQISLSGHVQQEALGLLPAQGNLSISISQKPSTGPTVYCSSHVPSHPKPHDSSMVLCDEEHAAYCWDQVFPFENGPATGHKSLPCLAPWTRSGRRPSASGMWLLLPLFPGTVVEASWLHFMA